MSDRSVLDALRAYAAERSPENMVKLVREANRDGRAASFAPSGEASLSPPLLELPRGQIIRAFMVLPGQAFSLDMMHAFTRPLVAVEALRVYAVEEVVRVTMEQLADEVVIRFRQEEAAEREVTSASRQPRRSAAVRPCSGVCHFNEDCTNLCARPDGHRMDDHGGRGCTCILHLHD